MKKNIHFLLFFILFSFSSQNLFSQQLFENSLSFKHLTTENGLSQNTVFCIFQDRNGYMWLGTEDGLNRFDGNHFIKFTYDPFDNSSISSSTIITMTEGIYGQLLIGTDGGGLNILNTSTSHFTDFKHDASNDKSISNDRVTGICRLNDSLYWVSTFGGGLNLFNAVAKSFVHFKITNKISNLYTDFIYKMTADSSGKLYLGTRNGFYIFNPVTKQFKSFLNAPGCSNCISSNNIQSVYNDHDKIWIGTFEGVLNCFNKQTGKISQFFNSVKSGNEINSIIRVSPNFLWLATRGGLIVFNENENTFTNFRNDPFNSNSLNNNNLYCFYKSSDGLLWTGTKGGGINLYHQRFNFLSVDQKFVKGTPDYVQNNLSIYIDSKGIIWSGSQDGGIRSYDKINNSILFFKNNPDDKSTLSSNSVWSIYEDDEGKMWIGTMKGGLNFFNRTIGKFFHYGRDTSDNASINSNNVVSIVQTRDKKLWMGTMQGGLNVFDKSTQKFFHYTRDTMHHVSVSTNNIICIKEDNHGNLLIGTQDGGLNILNIPDGKFEYYSNDPANKNTISSNTVQCIFENDKGLLWLGTAGGLNLLDRKKKIFHHFTEKNGLPNNIIYGILPDENGSLWISTNKGICKFSYPANLDVENLNNPDYVSKNISILNFDRNDGLIADEFNQGAYFKDSDGTMYFGGVKGIISFKPSEITQNIFNSPTEITRIKNYKEDILVNDSMEIVLDHKNYLTVEFASLSYIAPEKNKYAFMFEGRDTSWNDLGTTRMVSFLDLKPGEYVLKIRSSNNDGVWGTKPAVVKIKVNPPFYETAWFRISLVILTAFLVYLYVNSRIRKIKKEQTFKTELAEVEMKALRAQMNPHFIFNSLQSIGKYVMSNDKDNANEYLSRFSKLMRLILENSRKQEVSLEKDLSALELYMQLESLRFKKRFQYRVEVDPQVDKETTLIPPLLLQPFVENSILHGIRSKEDGLIVIKIKRESTFLHCTIEDNGIGREQSVKVESGQEKKRESLGMKITQERLNIINQQKKVNASVNVFDLKDETDMSCGLRIELLLPFVQDY